MTFVRWVDCVSLSKKNYILHLNHCLLIVKCLKSIELLKMEKSNLQLLCFKKIWPLPWSFKGCSELLLNYKEYSESPDLPWNWKGCFDLPQNNKSYFDSISTHTYTRYFIITMNISNSSPQMKMQYFRLTNDNAHCLCQEKKTL